MKVSICFLLFIPLMALANFVSVRYTVVDEDNNPLREARIMTYYRYSGNSLWLGSHESCTTSVTDSAGLATTKFFCRDAEFRTIVQCDGFYPENLGHSYFKHDNNGVFYENLLEHSKDIRVRLFPKKNPIPMHHWMTMGYMCIPQTNGVFGFDLKLGDWVYPYGCGEVVDFAVRYERTAADGNTRIRGVLSFPSGGAYRMKKRESSTFESVYSADTNAVYENEFPFGCEFTKGVLNRGRLLEKNEYWVLRTRVLTNAVGEVVAANYSKIYGPFGIDKKLYFYGSYFNPTPNDPNLEYDIKRNLSRYWLIRTRALRRLQRR